MKALVPDQVVWQFAWEVEDHFEPEEHGPAWRRLDQSMTPWLRLVDTLPDEVVADLAEEWSDIDGASSTFGTWLRWTDPSPQDEVREWLSTR